ncbi:hypothetical protein [Plantibacter flavus]|uniref:hypothetical protein n=1 Tax=Plantibacter flavus TaxID=150123 RepID=UPI000EAB4FD4
MTRRSPLIVIATVFALLVGVLTVAPAVAPSAEAANGSDFRAGSIISDQLFYDGGAMSAPAVQDFLNRAVPSCRAGYTCLKDYAQATPSRAAVSGRCAAYAGSGRESAASIISKVGAACGISQKAMIVLIEKEQGLITDTWPSDRQYRSATGYGCPDTADCDTTYYGFFNQVYAAALQFKNYQANPTRWNHVPGRVNAVRFSPTASCGSSNVFIENAATAGLYNYTPYQPNAAALANLYGTGDGCSAYGNRNFFRIYTDWFGPTNGVLNPAGAYDALSVNVGANDATISLSGWTLDLNRTSASLEAHVYLTYPDGSTKGSVMQANKSRPDVARAYPGAGEAHGYSTNITVTRGGTYTACVYGIGLSANRLLGCKSVSVPQDAPIGSLDAVRVTGSGSTTALYVAGWAMDPDAKSVSNDVHIYVRQPDGQRPGTAMTASASRPDVANVYPGAGAAHGFSQSFPVSAGGRYEVCVYSIAKFWQNVGVNTELGCVAVDLVKDFPAGSLDLVDVSQSATGASINVGGWTLDRGALGTAIPVHVYITDPTGKRSGYVRGSGGQRDDVNRVYGATGPHGFSESFPVTAPGDYQVCAYGIAVSPLSVGMNSTIGCRTVTVGTSYPVGSFDGAQVSGSTTAGNASLSVSGWTVDAQLPKTPIQMHVYVTAPDGTVKGYAFQADKVRSDIARIYPAYGGAHGLSESIPVTAAGDYKVCGYGIGTAVFNTGKNVLFGCTTVRVN